jgi:hypothetical protein
MKLLTLVLLLLVVGPALTVAQGPAPIQQREWRHPDPAFNLTMMELVNGNFSAAEAGFQKLAAAYPQDAESPFFQGVSQLRQNKYAQAVDSFKQALDRSPDHVEARWNLLVAAKMAGLDLEQLEEKYRSPLLAGPWARSSVQSPVRFENVGSSSGTAKVALGRGSAWADYDGDGDLDLLAVSFMSPHALFRNNGDGTFTDVAEQAGLRDSRGGWSALFADYDNDGNSDIYVTRNGWGGRGPNTLYRNNGNGTFTDVTKAAGVESPQDGFTACWADYDRDGFIDLYVANGVSSLYGELNSLFHNSGNGTFTDVAIPARVFEGHHSIGCAWGDADNDGYPDLYVVNYGEDNTYYHNNGDGTFSDWTAKAGVAAPKYGFVAFFFDYDHDGDLDLFVSSWASRMADVARFYLTGEPQGESGQRLFRNKGNGTFEDVTAQAGLGGTYGSMAANFGDINNDGFPEIYLGTGGPAMERYEPKMLFLNRGDGSFVDVTRSSRTDNLCKGHGQTFADFDGDGDLDIYSPCGGSWSGDRQPAALFRNPGTSNHWLTIRTRGVKSNRDGIGARVTVTVGGSRSVAEVTSGGGFGSTNSLELEFGLGKAAKADKIHIRWPSGLEQEFTDVAADQFVTITEGQKTLTFKREKE